MIHSEMEKMIDEEFIDRLEIQYKANLLNWQGKENIHQLITASVEEFGEIAKDILENKDPKMEIIHLIAVLYQIFLKNYI